jgi:hypothetical protein
MLAFLRELYEIGSIKYLLSYSVRVPISSIDSANVHTIHQAPNDNYHYACKFRRLHGPG